jgi:hypothetical protein
VQQIRLILELIICTVIENENLRIFTLVSTGAAEITPTFRKIAVDLKAVSGVWSIPLGRVHNKVFSSRHAVVR